MELLEVRVLDGANRFFTRPAIKLEFGGEPAAVEAVGREAGEAVQRLHLALGMPEPRVTARPSVDGRRVAVAFPWRRRTISQSIAMAAARIAMGTGRERREEQALQAVAEGPLPDVARPRIPVVGITGTNGKTTTTRLLAHIATVAGQTVGMTNSDGIYLRGVLVEAGDWTGFGGAGRVLAEPGIDLAVLETARGGILLRGIGYAHNDVSVVTNVSADHLGLQGIDTLDELAEVKAAVVRVSRRSGWAVLNADDQRVWAMRRQTAAHWYPFSMEPDGQAIRAALARGDRAAVLDRGWLVLLRAGEPALRLARAASLPVTVGGLSRYNVANALAAAAAADALGISIRHIRAGLRSFGQDTASNPGRLNLFERKGVRVLVDFAHNEAGLAGLLEVARSLTAPTGKLRLALGTAGDRTDDILRRMGALAGARTDDLVICEKRHYLRGRSVAQMNAIFRDGARTGGYRGPINALATELGALRALVERAEAGDVVAVMSHVERAEIFAWLEAHDFKPLSPDHLSPAS